MKHIIAALAVMVLLAGCGGGSSSSSPWNNSPVASAPAQAAPSALSPGQDPRLAYYRGLAGNALPPGAPPGSSVSVTPLPGDGTMPGYQSAMPAPVQDAPVKVALLVPLSGPHAELGMAMQNAAQLALFDMGYDSFELMPRDTGNTPQAAQQAAISALNDGAQLILGPVFADAVRMVKPVAAQRGVSVIAFSTDWTLAGGNTYIMGFLPFGQVKRVAEYAAQHNMQRIGILAPDNDYGNAVVSAYQAATQSMGLPSPSVKRFSPDGKDLSALVRDFSRYEERTAQFAAQLEPLQARVKANPKDTDALSQIEAINKQASGSVPYDAVMLPVGGEKASAIAGLLKFYDMGPDEVKLLGTGLWDDTALARDPALRGAWFAAPQPDLRGKFERTYRETYGSMSPPRLATLAYDATALSVVLARSGQQTIGRPSFEHTAITNPNGFSGIDGIFRFRPDGLVERGQAILTFKDMGIQMVERAPGTFQQSAPSVHQVRGGM
jgi:ABC-type branched-subunit amino acid transport system substrate-binding protein